MARSKSVKGHKADRGLLLLETAVAISGDLMPHLPEDIEYMSRVRRIIDLSIAFEAEARKAGVIWDETHDWVLCIESMCKLAVEELTGGYPERTPERMAYEVIRFHGQARSVSRQD